MPYTFSDMTTQRVMNYLSNLGSLSELSMVRDSFAAEVVQQERERQMRGLLANGEKPPAAALPTPPVVEEVVKNHIDGLSRNQRRLARRANGKAPLSGSGDASVSDVPPPL